MKTIEKDYRHLGFGWYTSKSSTKN